MPSPNSVILLLHGQEIEVVRARFGRWFCLEDGKAKVEEAVGQRDVGLVVERVCAYLSAASDQPAQAWRDAPWGETALAYLALDRLNAPRQGFPFLSVRETRKSEKVAWDYTGREWYVWLHLFASAYGWSAAEIEDLEIEVGLGLAGEILVEEQLQREFIYSLSETAYPYNPTTKKSEFKPLARPAWMSLDPQAVLAKARQVGKVPAAFLPVGNVIDLWRRPLGGTDD